MFHRIGRTVVRHPIWTIVAWVIATVAIVATAPSLPSNSDESSFLPKSYESIKATDLQQKAFPAQFTPSAIVLFQRADAAPADPRRHQGRQADRPPRWPARTSTRCRRWSTDRRPRTASTPWAWSRWTTRPPASRCRTTAAKTLRTDVEEADHGHRTCGPRSAAPAAQGRTSRTPRRPPPRWRCSARCAIIIITLLIIFRSPIIALLPLVVLLDDGLLDGQRADRRRHQGLRPPGEQLDRGAADRGAARRRHRLLPVPDVPLPRTAAGRGRPQGGHDQRGRPGSARPSPRPPARSSSPSSR